MRLLIARFVVLSVRLHAMALFRKFAKESITKSPPLPVKRRARLLVKESISNIHNKGSEFVPLSFFKNVLVIL